MHCLSTSLSISILIFLGTITSLCSKEITSNAKVSEINVSNCIVEFDSLFMGEVLINIDSLIIPKEEIDSMLYMDTSHVAMLAKEVKASSIIVFILDTLGVPCCFRPVESRKGSVFDEWVFGHLKSALSWKVVYCNEKKYPAKVYLRYHL